MKLVYPAIFTPCKELSGYTVIIPDLPGCVTEGRSLTEAIEMGVDAASGWILDELEDGKPIPNISDYTRLYVDNGSFINFLYLDIDSYSEKHGTKSIRRNVTIPAFLNSFGEKQNINFSKVLQDGLLNLAQGQQNEL